MSSAPKNPESRFSESALKRRLRRRLHNGSGVHRPAQNNEDRPASCSQEPIVYRRDVTPSERSNDSPYRLQSKTHVELTSAVDGTEICSKSGAVSWMLELEAGELEDGVEELCDSFHRCVVEPVSPFRQRLLRRCGLCEIAPEQIVFMDLETTGLSSTPVFLIGTMVYENQRLLLRQYFARNYAEERGILENFICDTRDKTLLVTFNGKTFDWPYVKARSAAVGVTMDLAPAHLDLLHVSRKVWKPSLPNCKLQTLERMLCGRYRSGDIPGHLIPDAYHDYVRTQNATHMIECLKHNQLDLLTLADLIRRLPPIDEE